MKPGEKLAILRHKKSYSVTDIAMKLDISSYEVIDWEEGKKPVPDNYLYPLCSLLGISVSDFLDSSYEINDDLVNHLDEEKEEIPSSIDEEIVIKEESPSIEHPEEFFSSGVKKDNESEKIYKHYKGVVISMNIMLGIMIFIFAFLIFFFMYNNFPTVSVFVFIFFIVYFIILLFILIFSSGVKKFRYKGHRIIIFYMFVVQRVYVDGERKKIKVIPGVHKGEAAVGFIDIGGEKLRWGAHKLYTEGGDPIEPDKED